MNNIGRSQRQRKLALVAIFIFIFYLVSVSAVLIFFNQAYKKAKGEFISIVRPDFSSFTDVGAKKESFFNYIAVLAEIEKKRILIDRDVLRKIGQSLSGDGFLSNKDKRKLFALATRYRLHAAASEAEILAELKLRINIVPTALIQAQAAIESGWGTSRFALQGHNLFGQWCFSKGCGIVPKSRAEGKTHEVAIFDSDAEAIRAYLLNLNSFDAYAHFRQERAKLAMSEINSAALKLAATLTKYSERGEIYVHELKEMILANNLIETDI